MDISCDMRQRTTTMHLLRANGGEPLDVHAAITALGHGANLLHVKIGDAPSGSLGAGV
jgi:hypothetical protein